MEGMNAHSPSSECHPTQVTIFGSVWFAVARITLEELGYHTTLKASRIEAKLRPPDRRTRQHKAS
jgi:hypothetical protein